ncbi:hypothetical protein QR680_012977 [Steinernema hermaphroditum]|uniref:Uncharacterized protein n=1 Tax=Steinernema hermaphroditum TaxID=289476 RepID=A0AA39I5K5_9BILA|nr:hypothetical protein QR680_012977 [Steinernema hermaphroditum]
MVERWVASLKKRYGVDFVKRRGDKKTAAAAQDSGPTADSRDPYRTLGTSPEPVVHPSPTARTDRGLEEEAPRSP